MGYTHYWYIKPGIKSLSKKCVEDIKKVANEHKDIIQFEEDIKKKPLITNKEIRFNGIGDDGHENFLFRLSTTKGDLIQKDKDGFVFDFCKTARKPYDIVVCKILLILKSELKENMKLSSDGFSSYTCSFEGEWNKAIEEVKQMGYKIDCCVYSRKSGDSIYYDCEIKSVESGGKYIVGDWKLN